MSTSSESRLSSELSNTNLNEITYLKLEQSSKWVSPPKAKRASVPVSAAREDGTCGMLRKFPKDDSILDNLLHYYHQNESSAVNLEQAKNFYDQQSTTISEPSFVKISSVIENECEHADSSPSSVKKLSAVSGNPSSYDRRVTNTSVEAMIQAPPGSEFTFREPLFVNEEMLWDKYGFRRQLTSSEGAKNHKFDTQYQDYADKRFIKWQKLLKSSGDIPSKKPKVKRYVRKGIPPKYRGSAWFSFSGANDHYERQPNLYKWILEQSDTLTVLEDVEFIERDLHRTFPDNIFFMASQKRNSIPKQVSLIPEYLRARPGEQDIICKLRRVLVAFSIHVPKAGYCQSLNFIAGLMLLFLDEEKAFWLLLILTQKFLPHVHDVSLEGASVDQTVLMLLIQEHLPKIWNRISQNFDGIPAYDIIARLPPITLVTSSWFLSCYIGSLPIETVLRVWDCLFYDGSVILFRCALAILKLGEKDLLSHTESVDIFQVVQNTPKTLNNPRVLIDLMYRKRSGIGSITQREIDSKRNLVTQKRKNQQTTNKLHDSAKTNLEYTPPPQLGAAKD